MDRQTDSIQFEAGNPILASCNESTRKELVKAGHVRHFERGSLLFADAEPGGLVMFLLDGSLQMVKMTARGRRQIICTSTCDSCQGICLLLFGAHGLAEVHGVAPGRVMLLERAVFERLTQEDPAFCSAAWDAATHCMLHLHTLVSQLSFNKVSERVAMLLLEESVQDGDLIRLTQSDLASTVGTTREVVARCLAGFQAEGLIRLGRGRITVKNREGLRSEL